jgi:Leucine-rich repeat (LRR) protein
MLPLWALCQQAELNHGGTVPPPMVANILHSVNPLLGEMFPVNTQVDLELAHKLPSWIRGVNIVAKDERIVLSAFAVTGMRSIQCAVSVPLRCVSAPSLKSLVLDSTNMADDDLAGIERCPALEGLSLSKCMKITSVRSLAASKCLKKLDLSYTSVTDTGLTGLESIDTLEVVHLQGTKISDVTNLATSKSLKELVLSFTSVTDAGLAGLELVDTMEVLDVRGCAGVTNLTNFATSKSLKKLHLWHSSVPVSQRTALASAGIDVMSRSLL